MQARPTGKPIHGRGATINPANRFEALHYELEDGCEPDGEPGSVRTQFFKDASQSIISYNNSPDVGFDASLNPYPAVLTVMRDRRTSTWGFQRALISKVASW
jgi:hypothetical protein